MTGYLKFLEWFLGSADVNIRTMAVATAYGRLILKNTKTPYWALHLALERINCL